MNASDYFYSLFFCFDLLSIEEESLKGLCESSEKPGIPTLVPNHTHINISPANLCFLETLSVYL